MIGVQLRTLLVHEFLINWRQRTLLMGSVVFAIVMLFVMFLTKPASIPEASEAVKLQASTLTLFLLLPVLHIFIIFLLPPLAVDIFARDRQYGVRELLDATPMSPLVYVLGKLGGLFMMVAIGVTLIMVVTGLAWWFLVYPFDLATLLGVYVVGVLPIALCNAGIAALLTISQPSRRRAVVIGMVFAIASVVLLILGLNTTVGIADYFNPGRPLLLLYYFATPAPLLGGSLAEIEPVSVAQLLLMDAAALLELVILVGVAQRWLRR